MQHDESPPIAALIDSRGLMDDRRRPIITPKAVSSFQLCQPTVLCECLGKPTTLGGVKKRIKSDPRPSTQVRLIDSVLVEKQQRGTAALRSWQG
jgi:hypothetical protein